MFNDIIQIVVICKNQQLDVMRRERDCPFVDIDEMKAFIELLYLKELKNGTLMNYELRMESLQMYTATISKRCFQTLVQVICFGDKTTRESQKKLDNLTPIHDIFEKFVSYCKTYYNIGVFFYN